MTRAGVLLAGALVGQLACHRAPPVDGVREVPEVRYRWGEPATEAGRQLLAVVPQARWDPGLVAAARELAAAMSSPEARLAPRAQVAATARAGFPGDARFTVIRNEGEFPYELVHDVESVVPRDTTLDVGLASRASGDGNVQWILGFAEHHGELDPMPRDLGLDAVLPVHVDVPDPAELVLVVAAPDGQARSYPLANRVTRQVDVFHLPGGYRLEVVDVGRARVDFVFEVFVEDGPPPLPPLPGRPDPPDPMAATEALYEALAERRAGAGLPPLARFPAFEPLAREHAAFMAAAGDVSHVLPDLTDGVAARARKAFHPGAEHHEALAAATTAEDALDLVWLSPGHRLVLLCASCTHVAIGTALEPATGRPPRLFVTWELVAFPEGTPRAIERRSPAL